MSDTSFKSSENLIRGLEIHVYGAIFVHSTDTQITPGTHLEGKNEKKYEMYMIRGVVISCLISLEY